MAAAWTVRLLVLAAAAALCLAATAVLTLPEEYSTPNSEEEENSCSNLERSVFRCRSGDCIDPSLLCDGKKDCHDGSDESKYTCKKRLIRATAEFCVLPGQPPNGRYSMGGCEPPACHPRAGTRVEVALLHYSCNPGFTLSGTPVVGCDLRWSSPFPTCVEDNSATCSPLAHPSRVINCYFGNKEVNCNLPMEPLTKAILRCKTFYEPPSDIHEYEVTCNNDGHWSKAIFPCTPKCGELNRENSVPWYAAVLTSQEGSWRFSCSASIIYSRVLISVARCFWSEDKQGTRVPDDFRVVVGEYGQRSREMPTSVLQQLQIERIFVPQSFRGYRRRYADDISVIILKNEIAMNEVTRPLCVDFSNKYSSYFVPGKIGISGSWGEPINKVYNLKTVSMPIVNFKECLTNIPTAVAAFLTNDKFCAGYLGNENICAGDTGVGFANQFQDGKWYLTGIASVYEQEDAIACDKKFYKSFTRLSLHYDFILKSLSDVSAEDESIFPLHTIARISCRENEYHCNSKECVRKTNLCDGKRHCSDGSDETYDICHQQRCVGTWFQCKYGACIDKKFVCNGENECADGSDEERTICNYPSETCTLPNQPANGHYILQGSATNNKPGANISVGVLSYSCNPGFELSGASLLSCYGGWSSEFPTCRPVGCTPLRNPSREIQCVLKGEDVDCETKSVAPGTTASVKCKAYYESIPGFQTYDMICENNGRWNRDLQSCIPQCGVPNKRPVPLIGHGDPAMIAEVPWHIGLYRALDNGTLVPSCGGSIVSSRVIVSAAHCFWENGVVSFLQYRIVAGKYYHAWENKTKYVQHLQIQEVVVPKNYKGTERNYANDIAVIILEYNINMNDAVRPVCVDFDRKYIRHFSPAGTVGKVAGWGLNENQTFSEVLNVANLLYVDNEKCENGTPQQFHAYLTDDKFCAGHANKTSVCPGDSGGGYTVEFRDGRTYLVGVVSIGPSEICALYPYAALTNVFNHLNFVREYVYKYV